MARKATPARYPGGPWPAEMRAPMVAAFFDFADTAELISAVKRGEAPRPTACRGRAGRKEPIWARTACDDWVAQRHMLPDNGAIHADDDLVAQLTPP
jgi:hypothetical protein